MEIHAVRIIQGIPTIPCMRCKYMKQIKVIKSLQMHLPDMNVPSSQGKRKLCFCITCPKKR